MMATVEGLRYSFANTDYGGIESSADILSIFRFLQDHAV